MASATAPATVSTPSKNAKKKRASSGSKKIANHPTYGDMIKRGILALKEPKGVSRQGLLKYIMGNFAVGGDARLVNAHLKMALRRMVKSGLLTQRKGSGASGSFKLSDRAKAKKTGVKKVRKARPAGAKKAKKSPKKKTAKKTKKVAAAGGTPAKKKRSPKKKSVTKKPKATKAKKPKTPKKARKSPKKKAAAAKK